MVQMVVLPSMAICNQGQRGLKRPAGGLLDDIPWARPEQGATKDLESCCMEGYQNRCCRHRREREQLGQGIRLYVLQTRSVGEREVKAS